ASSACGDCGGRALRAAVAREGRRSSFPPPLLDAPPASPLYAGMSFDFPVLVCDIGGTNARFSLKATPQAELAEPLHVRTHDYPGLAEAVQAILPKLAARPRAVIACGAGPIVDGRLKLTN